MLPIALHRTIHILLENFSLESAIGFQIKLVSNYSYYLMHKAISIKAIKISIKNEVIYFLYLNYLYQKDKSNLLNFKKCTALFHNEV